MLRGLVVAALLVSLGLSGCLGFGDEGEDPKKNGGHDDHEDCPDAMDHDAMDATEPETESDDDLVNATLLQLPSRQNETMQNDTGSMDDLMSQSGPVCPGDEPLGPNELPVPVLNMTSGEVTLDAFTAVYPGDSITFSAVGTSDPDGVVELIGLTVRDSNSTRNANLLANGSFVDAVLRFDHVGPVNITMRVLDDQGEGVVLHATAAVNLVVEDSASTVGPFPADDVADCEPAEAGTGQTLTAGEHWYSKTFAVTSTARWISVTTSGSQDVGLCAPDGTSLATGTGAAETEDQVWTPGVDYKAVATPSGANQSFDVRIEVHYEAKATA